ncbi:MAG: hypothetical protein ACFFCS_05995 [Candidatus Hodarchaeota archaeon]
MGSETTLKRNVLVLIVMALAGFGFSFIPLVMYSNQLQAFPNYEGLVQSRINALRGSIKIPTSLIEGLNQTIGGTVTPESYGAIGNGINNDTSAIQQALDAGSVVSLAGGSIYRIMEPLVVPTNSGLVSDPANPATILMDTDTGDFNGSTMVNVSSLCNCYPHSGGVGVIVENQTNVTLRNFKLFMDYKDHVNNIGIAARNSSNVTIFNIELTGFSISCGVISVDACNNSAIVQNHVHDIYSNSPNGTQITGIKIDDNRVNDNSYNIAIINNTVSNLSVGPLFQDAVRYQVDGIHVAGAGDVETSHHIYIAGNHIELTHEGIDSYGRDILIENNTIVGSIFAGIKLIHGAARHCIISNVIESSGDYGVLMTASDVINHDTSDHVIYNNIIRDIGNHPLGLKTERSTDAAFGFETCVGGVCTGIPVDNIMYKNRIEEIGSMECLISANKGRDNVESETICDDLLRMTVKDEGNHVNSQTEILVNSQKGVLVVLNVGILLGLVFIFILARNKGRDN